MFRFVVFTLSVPPLAAHSGQDEGISLLQLKAQVKQVPADSPCLKPRPPRKEPVATTTAKPEDDLPRIGTGLVRGTGAHAECEFPFPIDFAPGTPQDACMPAVGSRVPRYAGMGGGSYCLSKEPLPPQLASTGPEKFGIKKGPGGRAWLQCTPDCPGYIEPFTDLGSGWDCPDGRCICAAFGDPHVFHSFRGHHFDWHGQGVYQYGATKDGDVFHTFQTGQEMQGRTDAPPFTEAKAVAARFNGHNVVMMRPQWNQRWTFFDDDTRARELGASGYSLRIDDRCFIGSGCDWKGMECAGWTASGRKCNSRRCYTMRRDWDFTCDQPITPAGDIMMTEGLEAQIVHMMGEQRNKLGHNDDKWNRGKYFITSLDKSKRLLVSFKELVFEAPLDALENSGICANKMAPAPNGNPQDNPADGHPVPLDAMIFNAAEKEYLCNFLGKLPADAASGRKLCDPPYALPPKGPTAGALCLQNSISFEDARSHCVQFANALLQDCLFDYCATGGDERFVLDDDDAAELVDDIHDECAEEVKEAEKQSDDTVSAVGDPHITSYSGDRFDLQ